VCVCVWGPLRLEIALFFLGDTEWNDKEKSDNISKVKKEMSTIGGFFVA